MDEVRSHCEGNKGHILSATPYALREAWSRTRSRACRVPRGRDRRTAANEPAASLGGNKIFLEFDSDSGCTTLCKGTYYVLGRVNLVVCELCVDKEHQK